ncbi:hypothetical protein [Geodermatophilus sp. SYSU D00815]
MWWLLIVTVWVGLAAGGALLLGAVVAHADVREGVARERRRPSVHRRDRTTD